MLFGVDFHLGEWTKRAKFSEGVVPFGEVLEWDKVVHLQQPRVPTTPTCTHVNKVAMQRNRRSIEPSNRLVKPSGRML
jgi:hypothetical protein